MASDSYGDTVVYTAVEEEKPPVAAFELYQNYPNPFNSRTRISFSISGPSPVKITIFNTLGQIVKTIGPGTLSAGLHSVTWDGDDQLGHAVSSGIYYYRLETLDGISKTKRLLLMK